MGDGWSYSSMYRRILLIIRIECKLISNTINDSREIKRMEGGQRKEGVIELFLRLQPIRCHPLRIFTTLTTTTLLAGVDKGRIAIFTCGTVPFQPQYHTPSVQLVAFGKLPLWQKNFTFVATPSTHLQAPMPSI